MVHPALSDVSEGDESFASNVERGVGGRRKRGST
jgi:hypothetical protein